MPSSLSPTLRPRRHWAACGTLAGGVLVLFLPALLGGLMPFSMDTAMQFFPARYRAATLLANGELPFWNRGYFLGTPLLANPQWGLLYPPHWLFLLRPTGGMFTLDYALHVLIGAAGCYALTHEISRRRAAACVSAALLVGNSYTWAHLAFGAFLNATAWIPWTLWGLIRFARTGHWRHLLGCAVFWALQLLAGAPQVAWYAALNYGLLGVLLVAMPLRVCRRVGQASRLSPERSVPADVRVGQASRLSPERSAEVESTAKQAGRLSYIGGAFRLTGRFGPLLAVLLFGFLGACFAAPQLAPTAAFVRDCDRAGGLQWGEVESGTLPLWFFLKVFLGGTGQGWEDAEKTCSVTGLGLLFVLFSLAWFRRSIGVRCLWILLAADIAFCNWTLGALLYRFFPLYSAFHDPQRILCVVQVCLAVLGGIGVQAFVQFLALRAPGSRRAAGAVVVPLAAAGFVAAFWNWADPLPADWRHVFVGWERVVDPWPVFVGASVLCLSAAWLVLARSARRRAGRALAVRRAVVLFGVGIAAAGLAFSARHVDTKVAPVSRLRSPAGEKLEGILASSPAPRYLTVDLGGRYSGDFQRPDMADLLLPNLSDLYDLRDIQGYDPFIPVAYAQWLDRINGTPQRPMRRHFGIVSPQAALTTLPAPWGAIVTQKELPAIAKEKLAIAPPGEVSPLSEDGNVVVIRPRSQIPYVQVLSTQGRPLVPQPQVTWTLTANRLRATVPPHAAEQVLQVNESPLAGWRARVDGARVEMVPSLLTVVPLPPSPRAQEVRLDYWPPYLTEGILAALAAALAFVLSVRMARRPRTRPPAA